MRLEYDAAFSAEMSGMDADDDNDDDIAHNGVGGPPPSAGDAGLMLWGK